MKLTWEKKTNWLQGGVSCVPFYIVPRSIWDICIISSWNGKTLFLNVCGCCQEMSESGCSHFGILLVLRKVPNKLISQFRCFGAEFHFKFRRLSRTKWWVFCEINACCNICRVHLFDFNTIMYGQGVWVSAHRLGIEFWVQNTEKLMLLPTAVHLPKHFNLFKHKILSLLSKKEWIISKLSPFLTWTDNFNT